MASLASVKDNDRNPALFVKVAHTSSDKFRNEKFTCDFCEKKLTPGRYHRPESDLRLCKSCLMYMASLPPSAEKAVERFLLGNVL